MEKELLTHEEATRLLDRYFAADSSLAEEERLRAYFRSGRAAPELQEFRALFGYWDELTAAGPLTPVRATRRRPLRHYLAAAAGILLLIAAFFAYPATPATEAAPLAEAEATEIDWSKYEITDPEEAVRVLHGALKTASNGLQKGPRITVRGLQSASKIID